MERAFPSKILFKGLIIITHLYNTASASQRTQCRPPPNSQPRVSGVAPLSQPLVFHQQKPACCYIENKTSHIYLSYIRRVCALVVVRGACQSAVSGKWRWSNQSVAARPRWSVHGPPIRPTCAYAFPMTSWVMVEITGLCKRQSFGAFGDGRGR